MGNWMYVNEWIFENYVSKIDYMYIYVCMYVCMSIGTAYVCMYVRCLYISVRV